MYRPEKTLQFYDAYGGYEWSRLEETAHGRLQAIIHGDFLKQYVRAGDRVLDVGCGPGRFAVEMARLGASVTLLDISRGQLRQAVENVADADVEVRGGIQADMARLPLGADAQFDVVVAFGGALSYVCEQRQQAADELMRVTRPGGTLLVSAMSRLGTVSNIVRRPQAPVLQDPEAWHLWPVLQTGDLPPFPSRIKGLSHPAMHLYTSVELRELFGDCDILEVAGSNVSTYEGSPSFDDLAAEETVWENVVQVERVLCRQPGIVDTGSHIIMAARKR